MRINIYLLLLLLGLNFQGWAQPGSLCSDPVFITSVPYIQTGLTTNSGGNNYNTSPCGNSYMSGYDYVFSYTPASDINVDITLTNTGLMVGLFVFKGCPDDPSSECIIKKESASGNPFLVNVQLLQDSTYYIIVSTYNLMSAYPVTNFDISVTPTFPIDADMRFFYLPKSGCHLGAADTIIVVIKNLGSDTIFDLHLAYSINGGTPVLDSANTIFPPLQYIYQRFQTTADFSASGTYYIKAWTDIPGDMNPSNDTMDMFLTKTISVSSFPYTQNFESGSGSWATEWTAGLYPFTSWQLGAPLKPVIDSAASASNCWVTSLTGNTMLAEASCVIGPCFDFTSLSLPVFEMDIWYQTADVDLITLQSSIDSGYTWTQVGTYGQGQNWYNTPPDIGVSGWNGSSGGWLHAKNVLSGMAGQSNVMLRVMFDGSQTETSEGFAFDNISIHESAYDDLQVAEILSPVSSCGFSGSDSVTIKIVNLGLNTQQNYPVSFSTDSGLTWTSEIVTDPIHLNDTAIFTFTGHASLTTSGLYHFMVKIPLPGDEDTLNNLIEQDIVNYGIIVSFPWVTDFESGNDGWYSSGVNNSWQYGVPVDTVITHAASGTHAWVTNLSGYCNEGEVSYLTGPCFDLADAVHPDIRFNIWYATINPGGAQLEYSIDGSTTWAVLGHYTDTTWYSQGYMWIGSSGTWKQMIHSLDTCIGHTVQFRLKFSSIIPSSGIGFDDFMLCEKAVAGFTWNVADRQVTFTNSSSFSTSWAWDFGDGTSSVLQNPLHEYTTPDTFIVRLISSNICGADTIMQTISFTGIQDNLFSGIVVTPNPAHDKLHINFGNMNGIANAEITDLSGKKIFTISEIYCDYQKELIIPIDRLTPGMYLLKINTSHGTVVKKIVKE